MFSSILFFYIKYLEGSLCIANILRCIFFFVLHHNINYIESINFEMSLPAGFHDLNYLLAREL